MMKYYSTLTKVISVAVLAAPFATVCAQAQVIDRVRSNSNLISQKKTIGMLEAYGSQNKISVITQSLAVATGLFEPRTELGRKLLEHRRNALAEGMKLLTVDEINSMIKEGRGEFA